MENLLLVKVEIFFFNVHAFIFLFNNESKGYLPLSLCVDLTVIHELFKSHDIHTEIYFLLL